MDWIILKVEGGGGGSSLQPLHVQQAGRTDAVQTMVYAARADRGHNCAVFTALLEQPKRRWRDGGIVTDNPADSVP